MEDLELDNSWINEVEKYNSFYEENNNNINIVFLFATHKHEIINIKCEKHVLNTPNILRKEELLYIIKNKIKAKKYKLDSIIQFNFSLTHDEIIHLNKQEKPDISNIIKKYSVIEDIYMNDSINYIQDMNSLYILLIEKDVTQNNITRKIGMSDVILQKMNSNKGDSIRNKLKLRRRTTRRRY